MLAQTLWIALGGAVGSVARFFISFGIARAIGETFPWGTLVVNVTGCVIIGFLTTLTEPGSRYYLGPDARSFALIGVLGGYTTFSSFSQQTLNLARDGEWLWAGGYVTASVVLCLVGVWLGFIAGTWFNQLR
jgi:fluoride exporter